MNKTNRYFHSNATYEHRSIAEAALGRSLPRGVEVHHHDENEHNNANSNLVICESSAYHKLLHVRMRLIKLGADPNTEKRCSKCKRVLPRADFYTNKNVYDGLSYECRPCVLLNRKAFYRRRHPKLRVVLI